MTVDVIAKIAPKNSAFVGLVDSDQVIYAPAEPTDWVAEPDAADGALDELAERVKGLEGTAVDAADVIYTPTTEADWDAVPAAVDGGLDELAGRVTDLEDAQPAYKQLWVGGWKPTLTAGCYYLKQIEMGTNKNVYDYWAFDKDAIMYAYANVAMPDDYTGGTILAKFYWTHPATTTNFKVSWGLQAVSFSDDDALDAAFGTAQYANDTGGTTSDLYISPQTSEITIGGTPVAGDLVNFRVLRKADDGTNDTLAVDAYLLGVMIWYPV